jgi:hypothetical protein
MNDLQGKNINNILSFISPAVFIILLILKLTGIIGMHWFWIITSLWWGPIVVFFFLTVLYFMIFGIAFFTAFFFKGKGRRGNDRRNWEKQ